MRNFSDSAGHLFVRLNVLTRKSALFFTKDMNVYPQFIKNGTKSLYPIGLTAAFLLVGAITAVHHEMWRDEIQAWLLARESTSLVDLYSNLKYEGHPGLWHICLWILNRLSHSPSLMQGFHLLIASATVYLFARYSPFTALQKFLFTFGYFSLYEYSIVCRNYALGVLLICIVSILFRQRYTRFLWICLGLVLLGHTSVHALIVAIAISGVLLMEYIFRRKHILAANPIREWRIVIGFSLLFLGMLVSVLQIIPPSDTGFAVGWYTDYNAERCVRVMKTLTHALFPIPEATRSFWGSRWLENFPFYTKIQFVLACLLFSWFSLLLFRKPVVGLIFLFGMSGLLTFFYIKYYGSIRHHGFLFLMYILAGWMYHDCELVKLPTFLNRLHIFWEKSFRPMFTVILIFHFIGGSIAVCMEYRHVFSYGKAAAAFIKANEMQEMLMIGDKDSAVSTIVGYLEKDQIYYPRSQRFGSFIIWNQTRRSSTSNDEVLLTARQLTDQYSQDILIILNRPLAPRLISQHSLTAGAQFTGATVSSEEFYIYLMSNETAERGPPER